MCGRLDMIVTSVSVLSASLAMLDPLVSVIVAAVIVLTDTKATPKYPYIWIVLHTQLGQKEHLLYVYANQVKIPRYANRGLKVSHMRGLTM